MADGIRVRREEQQVRGLGSQQRYCPGLGRGGPQIFLASLTPPGWMVLFLSGERGTGRKLGFESADAANEP